MNVYERIKDLANKRHISIAELERNLNLSNGSISKWANSSPSADKLSKVAEYFGVNMDYLIGRTEIVERMPKNDDAFFRLDLSSVPDDKRDQLKKNILEFKRMLSDDSEE